MENKNCTDEVVIKILSEIRKKKLLFNSCKPGAALTTPALLNSNITRNLLAMKLSVKRIFLSFSYFVCAFNSCKAVAMITMEPGEEILRWK